MYGSVEDRREENSASQSTSLWLWLWSGSIALLVVFLSLLSSSIYWTGSTPRLFLSDVFGAASGRSANRTISSSQVTITNYVSGSAGEVYGTIQNSKVSSTIRTNQDDWMHLPQGGWRLAPHNFDSLLVAQAHMWGTSCLVLDDGTCVRSKTSSLDWWVSDVNKKGLLQDQLLTREEGPRPALLGAVVKSRRPSPSPTQFLTAPSSLPTARPTKSSPPSLQPSSSPTPAPSTAKPTPSPTPSPTAPPSPEPTSATVVSSSESLYAPADDGLLAEQILITLCRPGTRHNPKARGAERTCVPCSSGFYSKSFGASKCSPCPKGGYSSAGSSLCSLQLPFHGLMLDTPLPLAAPTTQYFEESASFPAPLGALLGVVDLPPTYFYTLDLYLTGVQTARTVLLQGVGGNSSCWFAKGSCDGLAGHIEVPRLSLVPDTLQLEINLASDSDALLGLPTAGGNESAPSPQPSWTPIRAISQPLLLNRWQTISVSVTQDVVSVAVTDSLTGQLAVRALAVDWRRDEPMAGVRLFSGVDPLSSEPVLPPASSMRNLFICESMGACTCPAGSFRSPRTLECDLCPPGTFSAVTNTAISCSPCPAGLYSSVSGAVTCFACAAGMESSKAGACFLYLSLTFSCLLSFPLLTISHPTHATQRVLHSACVPQARPQLLLPPPAALRARCVPLAPTQAAAAKRALPAPVAPCRPLARPSAHAATASLSPAQKRQPSLACHAPLGRTPSTAPLLTLTCARCAQLASTARRCSSTRRSTTPTPRLRLACASRRQPLSRTATLAPQTSTVQWEGHRTARHVL